MSRDIKERCGIITGFLLLFAILTSAYYMASAFRGGHGDVSVIFVQTQADADCSILFQEGAAIMIDTGEEKDAEHILQILQENNIKKLDYLVLSHGDQDHIGGAEKILSEIEVEQVVEPLYNGNTHLDELNEYIKGKKIHIIYPTHNMKIRAGEIKMTVFPPLEKKYTDENNYSLAVLAAHKSIHLLFTGDALRKRSEELEMIHWPQINVYKVPHHGRANRETGKLMKMAAPEFAIVTSDICDSAVEECTKELEAQLLYTLKEEITMISDGNTIVKK